MPKLKLKCPICRRVFYKYASNKPKNCSRRCGGIAKKRAPHVSPQWIRLQVAWRGMIRRCYRERCPWYPYYGGRGIRVCNEWKNSFKAFYDWSIANGYKDHLEIDRIKASGNYSPGNCRWATRTQQMQNTRRRKNSGSRFKGVTLLPSGRWRAQIRVDKKYVNIGCHATDRDAAKAYDAAAMKFFGEFAYLNFPRKEGASF